MNASSLSPSAAQTIEALREWFADRFLQLADLGTKLVDGLTFDPDGNLEVSAATRRAMKAAATHFLADHPVVDGCGLIFAHSALGTENGLLEWWVREDESRFARYSFGVVPGADRYYDYEQHEWFVRAFAEGRTAAVGPYIDYLGVEVYIVTLTLPAVINGRRVGAVGNDIQVDDLERELLPLLLRCDAEVALLSGRGSVILSNSTRFLPGELVESAPNGGTFHPLSEEADGMQVLVMNRSARYARSSRARAPRS